MSMMDSECVEGYIYMPPLEFVEDSRQALNDLSSTDSIELWLLKLPFSNDLFSDLDEQELSLEFHSAGYRASIEGSSGKVYDVVSYVAQEPDERVFLASATNPKIAGKISRRVSIAHYPDPKELVKLNSIKKTHRHENSAGVTVTNSSRYFPMQSGNRSQSGRAASSKGSRQKSSLSEVGKPSNAAKRRVSKSIKSEDLSNGRNGPEISHGHSTGISSMSSDHSHGGKSKRRKLRE